MRLCAPGRSVFSSARTLGRMQTRFVRREMALRPEHSPVVFWGTSGPLQAVALATWKTGLSIRGKRG